MTSIIPANKKNQGYNFLTTVNLCNIRGATVKKIRSRLMLFKLLKC